LPNNSSPSVGEGRAYGWSSYSDDRVKSNQQLINYGLDEILLLKPKRYNHHTSEFKNDQLIIYKNDYKNEIGLVAQDVYAIIPEAVTVPEDENTDLWSMDYDKLVPVLIKGMQEQQEQIESQQSQIDELSEMISEMKTEIASLRSQ
jgi:hypothetical protein